MQYHHADNREENDDFVIPSFNCGKCGSYQSNIRGQPPKKGKKSDSWRDGSWTCIPVKCPSCNLMRIQCRYCNKNFSANQGERKGIRNCETTHFCEAKTNALTAENDRGDGGEQQGMDNESANVNDDRSDGDSNSGAVNNDDSGNANYDDGDSICFSNGSGNHSNDELQSDGVNDDEVVPPLSPRYPKSPNEKRTPVSTLFPSNSASRAFFSDHIDYKKQNLATEKGCGMRGMVWRALNGKKPDEASQGTFGTEELTIYGLAPSHDYWNKEEGHVFRL